MTNLIQLALQILNNISSMLNRETSADEKIKDGAVSSGKHLKKAIFYARQIFDGNKRYKGLDILLKGKLEEKDYETYLKLRAKFNKYSST